MCLIVNPAFLPLINANPGLDFTITFFDVQNNVTRRYYVEETVIIYAQVKNTGTETIDAYRLEGVFTIISPSSSQIDARIDWNTFSMGPDQIAVLEGSWTVPSGAELGWYAIKVVVTSKDTDSTRSEQKDNAFEVLSGNVHLRSRAYDGSSNVGSIWVEGVGEKGLPADIYLEPGQYLVVGSGGMFDGKKYSFDKWETSGELAVSGPSREDPTITVNGEGTLTLVLFKWDFTLDVSPTSRTVTQGDGAIYSVTITATGGWTTDTGQTITVDVESLGEPPDTTTSGPGLFYLSQSSPTDTHTFTIYTVETTPTGTYDITLRGTITSTTTSHSVTVQLVVESKIELLPDLIIVDFWWEPSIPNPGHRVTFTYIEKNQGDGDAPAHRNTLWIDDYPISNDVVDALSAGASRNRTFSDTWTATAGAHDALVKADDQNAVTESDEENNVLPKTIGTKEQISTSLAVSLNPSSIPPNARRRITISGRLTRSDTGAGIADRPIRLDWTGGLTTVTTNAEGYYAYSTDVGPYTEGSYEFTARFEGYETPSTIFLPSTGSDTLSVGKIATDLTITLDPSSIEENTITDVTISGRLTRADTGAGLGDKAINFNYGWGGSVSTTTDGDGEYSKIVMVSLSAGSYLVSASFEGDSIYGSSSDTAILYLQEVGKADLVILDIFWDPSNPFVGASVSFSYIIKNQGTKGTTDFTNALYINGERIDISSRRSMAAGETLTRYFTYAWTATEGSHNITVVADDLKEVSESNEANNKISKTLPVWPEAPILEVSPTSISKTVITGESATETLIILNTGDGELKDVGLSASGDIAGWVSFRQTYFSSIPAGQSRSVTITISVPKGTVERSYPGNILIASTNGGNKSVNITIALEGTAKSISAKIVHVQMNASVYNVGETIRINVTIRNMGDVDWEFFVMASAVHVAKFGEILSPDPVTQLIRKGTNSWIILTYRISDTAIAGTYRLQVDVFDPVSGDLLDSIMDFFAFMIETGSSYIETVRLTIWGFDKRALHIHVSERDMDRAVSFGLSTKSWKGLFLLCDILLLAVGSKVSALRTAPDWLKKFSGALTGYKWMKKIAKLPNFIEVADFVVLEISGDWVWIYDATFQEIYKSILPPLPINTFPIPVDISSFPIRSFFYLFGGTFKSTRIESQTPLGAKYNPGDDVSIKIKVTDSENGDPILGCPVSATISSPVESGDTSSAIDLMDSGDGIYVGTYQLSSESPIGSYNIFLKADKPPYNGARGYVGYGEDTFTVCTHEIGATVVAESVFSLEKNETQFESVDEVFSSRLDLVTNVEAGKVVVNITSDVSEGTVIAINADNITLPISDVKQILVLFDGKEIGPADDYADILNPHNEDVPEYLVMIGAWDVQVLVSIPNFSTHTIIVTRRTAPPTIFEHLNQILWETPIFGSAAQFLDTMVPGYGSLLFISIIVGTVFIFFVILRKKRKREPYTPAIC